MPFNVDAPMDLVSAPARYPSPDWAKTAEVVEVLMPGEKAVGWLVIQEDMALTWLSSAGPDRPAAQAVRSLIEDAIRLSLTEGRNVREAWNDALSRVYHGPPAILKLPELAERLQEEWS